MLLQVLAFAGLIAYIIAASAFASLHWDHTGRSCCCCKTSSKADNTKAVFLSVIWPAVLIVYLGWYIPPACRYLYKKLTEPRPPRPLPDLKPRQPWENA